MAILIQLQTGGFKNLHYSAQRHQLGKLSDNVARLSKPIACRALRIAYASSNTSTAANVLPSNIERLAPPPVLTLSLIHI